MTTSDWLIIAAIILAPIVAIRIQTFLENRKAKKERQLKIFRSLMKTRATPLSPLHVEALNMIDIEFYEKTKVVDAWKLLLDNFEHYPQDTTAQDYKTKLDASQKKSEDLHADLLYEMAKELKYKFDKVHLKRGIYIPRGHAELEMDQFMLRKKIVDLFYGETALPIKIVDSSVKTQSVKTQIM